MALTAAQCSAIWLAAGGDPAAATTMGAIAIAESSGIVNNTNRNGPTSGCPNGSTDYGLWQINDCYNGGGPQDFDPMTCARDAIKVYKAQGFAGWNTYTNGAYKQYMPSGNAGSNLSAPSANGWLGGIGSAIQGVENDITGFAGGIFQGAESFLQALFGGAVSPFLRLPQSLINIGWNFGGFSIGIALLFVSGLLLLGFVFEEGLAAIGSALTTVEGAQKTVGKLGKHASALAEAAEVAL